MFLDKLIIKSKKGVIREIVFKTTGLNLIIDNSEKKDRESGNSVGKTTLLRSIDYCFGSEGKDFYEDREFRNSNDKVLNFLKNNEVTFILHFHSINNVNYQIERKFSKDNSIFLNGKEYKSITSYRKALETELLNIYDSKPSIRQIMPKFIRKDKNSMSKTLKFLHDSTNANQYELIYFYLFGFTEHDLITKRYNLKTEIDKTNRKLKVIKNGKSLAEYKERLKITESIISKKEQEINSFKVSKTYETELLNLNKINHKVSLITPEISSLDLKLSLSNDTIEELKANKSLIDPSTLKEIYNEAKEYIPKIQKSFEEVLKFHNDMIDNKIQFINKGIDKIKRELHIKRNELNKLLDIEQGLFKELNKTGTLSDLQLMQKGLNELFERKGNESQIISMIEELENKVKHFQYKINSLNDRINTSIEDFQNKISLFNHYFSSYSDKLYGEQYYLVYNPENNDFKVGNIQGNVGSGKKKGEISSFDLAYLSFSERMKSKIFRFVMHDSPEDIDINQLKKLFEISNTINGQYFVSVLRDKIISLGQEFIDKYKIIELSEDDKFFRF